MSRREQPWHPDVVPPPGSVVRVAAPGSSLGLSATVVEVDRELLRITRPGSVVTTPPEGPVTVSWTDVDGLHELAAELGGDEDGSRWHLWPRGAITVQQRRERGRVVVEGEEVLVAAGWRLRASLLDLGPTGARCLIAGDVVLEEGGACTLSLTLVTPQLVVPGVIVRVREALDANLEVAVRFTTLDAEALASLERFLDDRAARSDR